MFASLEKTVNMDCYPYQKFDGNDLVNLVKTIFTTKENLRPRIIRPDGFIYIYLRVDAHDTKIFLNYRKDDNTLNFDHGICLDEDGLYDINYERVSEEDFYKKIKSWL